MIPTLFVAQLTGPGVIHLSLHTSRDGALARVAAEGRDAWRRAFGYDLPAALPPEVVIERLDAEGWVTSVEEYPVELTAAEEADAEAAHQEARAEDRDAERAGQPY